MNSRSRLLQGSALLIFAFILGSLLLGSARTPGARAQEGPPAPAAPAAVEAPYLVHTCTPLEISTFENRIHVQCVESAGSIRFFAAATANPANAARMLSTLTAAQLSGRALLVTYNPDDTSGDSFGCLPADCRKMTGVSVGQ